MAFKGGTSLSKVYSLINRFSEDVDVTLDYRKFDDTGYSAYPDKYDPFGEGATNSQSKKFGERLKEYAAQYIRETVVPHLENSLATLSNHDDFKVSLDEDQETVYFVYPSVESREHDYLGPVVRLEFGGRKEVVGKNWTVA